MPIPKRIHRVWLGGPMPAEFIAYERAWRSLHPDWEVHTWSEAELGWLANVDVLADAPSLSAKSDVARYEIVLREGGLYVDCDIEPLRPVDALLDGVDLVVSEEQPGLYGSAFFAASPGHPVLAYAVAELAPSYFARPEVAPLHRIGPVFWTRCVRRRCAELGLEPRVLARDEIYPYSWAQPHLRHQSFPDAWAVHHWAKSWHPDPDSDAGGLGQVVRSGAVRVALEAKRSVRRVQERWDQVEPRSPRAGRWPRSATYLGDGRLLVSTTAGFPVLARADDLVATPALVVDGMHDPGFSRFIAREIGEGDVVVDVGAGIGLHTLSAALAVGEIGRVFAFEPDPVLCDLMRRSVAINRERRPLAEVSVVQQLVGRHTDPEKVTLDDVLHAVAELTLVRIDVGGVEHEVLDGMAELLSLGRVRMLDVVLSDRAAGATWGALVDGLRSIIDAHRPATFTIDSDGGRTPVTLDAAVHGDGLRHFVLDFVTAR